MIDIGMETCRQDLRRVSFGINDQKFCDIYLWIDSVE